MAFSVVGRPLPRLDARAKVTGAARYAADLHLPGELQVRLLRSPFAHARIRAMDTAAAAALPGVVAIMDYRNAPATPFTNGEWDAVARDPAPGDQFLFDQVVRYAGEPVAAVAAVDAETALAALDLVRVDYDPLPVVTEPEAALAPGAPMLHPDRGSNLARHLTFTAGDVAAGFAAADHVLERRFVTGRQKQVQMEPWACTAAVAPDGKATLWTPNQTPHFTRIKLGRLFGLPMSKLRIITPTIGGGFGGRIGLVGEPICLAMALLTRRPCQLVYSRTEDFVGTEARHPVVMDLKVGFTRDGTLTALACRSYLNAGPYLTHSPAVAAVHGRVLMRLYKCPHMRYDGHIVYTNAPLAGGFRGFGGPQAYFALEQVMDEVAAACGVDALALRECLAYGQGDTDPWSRLPVPDDAMRECLRRGAAAIGWAQRRRVRPGEGSGGEGSGGKGSGGEGAGAQAAAPGSAEAGSLAAVSGAGGATPPDGGPWRRGVGMGAVMWVSGTACLGEGMHEIAGATVRLNVDGTYNLATGAIDLGTGARTAIAQVVAETLGCSLEQVDVTMDDTDVTPLDSGSHATRTLFVCGGAARAAAAEVRRQVLEVAGEVLEAAPADLELRDGCVRVQGAPARRLPVGDVAKVAVARGRELAAQAGAPQVNSPPFGAHFAEVAVNVETGQVKVLRYVAVHDVGRAINPLLVEGQVEGAVVQGLGYALCEDLRVDPETGSTLNASFADYKVLTAADVPPIETVLVESPDPAGPYGAKGVGEPGIVPVAAALANAVADATGVRIYALPLTPERVLRALREAGKA